MYQHIHKLLLPGMLSSLLLACNTAAPARDGAAVSYGVCGDRLLPGVGLELSIARDLYQQGRARSALAHLEELSLPYPDARILQADALRSIGDTNASDVIYNQLTSSCLAASAYRGLSLNAFERRQVPQALGLMTQARRAAPTDANIRNDLGYLMMLDGNHSAAEEEFLTALELDTSHVNAAQNLVMLYLHRGLPERAQRTAEAYGVLESSMQVLSNNIGQP